MEFNSNLLLHALSYVFFGLVESFDSLFGIFDLLLLSFSLKLDYFELIVELSIDRKSTRLNSSHIEESRMPSSA